MGEHHKRVDKSFTAPDLLDPRAGGEVLGSSDELFGAAANLLTPAEPIDREHFISNCGSRVDGWETRRRRGPGFDWLIIKLASPAHIQRVLLDTSLCEGSYPEAFCLEGAYTELDELVAEELIWSPILEQTPVTVPGEQVFQDALTNRNVLFSHVRLNIYPDGGVNRLRVYGYPKLLKKR